MRAQIVDPAIEPARVRRPPQVAVLLRRHERVRRLKVLAGLIKIVLFLQSILDCFLFRFRL